MTRAKSFDQFINESQFWGDIGDGLEDIYKAESPYGMGFDIVDGGPGKMEYHINTDDIKDGEFDVKNLTSFWKEAEKFLKAQKAKYKIKDDIIYVFEQFVNEGKEDEAADDLWDKIAKKTKDHDEAYLAVEKKFGVTVARDTAHFKASRSKSYYKEYPGFNHKSKVIQYPYQNY